MQKDDIPQASLPGPAAAPLNQVTRAQRDGLPRTEWERLIQNRRFILLVLFGVTGALGLPLLWISSGFSTTEKVVWSLVNLLYTLALVALCIAICVWAYSRILSGI